MKLYKIKNIIANDLNKVETWRQLADLLSMHKQTAFHEMNKSRYTYIRDKVKKDKLKKEGGKNR